MPAQEWADRERRMLRALEMQIRNEDPALARRLSYGAPAIGQRYSPTRWPWQLHLALAVVFILTGTLLGVLSAAALGSVFLVAALARWASAGSEVIGAPERGPATGRAVRPRTPPTP